MNRLCVVEYLLYILTCFGSWFGISIFGTSQVLNNLMKKLISDRNRCLKRRYKPDDRNLRGKNRLKNFGSKEYVSPYLTIERNRNRNTTKFDSRNTINFDSRNTINFDNRHTLRPIRHYNNRVGILNMNRYNQPYLTNYRMKMFIP